MKSKTTLCLLALLIGLTGCVTEKLPPVSLYTLDPDLDAIKAPVSYTHLTLPTTIGWCRSRWSPYH